jgi:methenyltetrahydromethanopterin cyclohydrolase
VQLNHNALELCEALIERADRWRIAVVRDESGARIIDCGVLVPGGLEAGRRLAEICMAGLGHVEIHRADAESCTDVSVSVRTDQPVAGCMASQYAGWQIAGKKFFAMGSGPMRAAGSSEKLFDKIGFRERPPRVVGVLEAASLPPADVCEHLAAACGVELENLTLLVARTASQAGNVQVVARSVETALHQLCERGFDLSRVQSGFGTAPLPPVARDDLAGIGRTNDAVLYGGRVTLWVRGDDATIERIGPLVPSSASADYGEPFASIFERYGRDFYKIDPHLFSPAVVTFQNLDTGRTFQYGRIDPAVLRTSFGLADRRAAAKPHFESVANESVP